MFWVCDCTNHNWKDVVDSKKGMRSMKDSHWRKVLFINSPFWNSSPFLPTLFYRITSFLELLSKTDTEEGEYCLPSSNRSLQGWKLIPRSSEYKPLHIVFGDLKVAVHNWSSAFCSNASKDNHCKQYVCCRVGWGWGVNLSGDQDWNFTKNELKSKSSI